MKMFPIFLSVYIFPFLFILTLYLYLQHERERKSHDIKKSQVSGCSRVPISLHPLIERAKCMGCGACVAACPEKNVIGIVNREATLIVASKCIGHGSCRAACPFGAISLVFGSEKCGVDIPYLQPNFETNVSGVFIAGELGGMGLICNAIEQGRQAMESISSMVKKKGKMDGVYDVAIVGVGPAGFSASLLAMEKGLNYVTLEQESLGGTVAHYPRGKIVMTRPAVLPTIGKTKFKQTTKEELLKFWQDIETRSGIKINYSENVKKVARDEAHFTVITQKASYKTQTVLLALGRRGTPRKLGVPGEEKNKVVYSLVDPLQYQSQHVMVVGGGNSALEAVLSLSATKGVTATLSCLGETFSGAKQENSEKVLAAQKQGQLNLLMRSSVKEIRDKEVILDQAEKKIEVKNDAVIVCAGGILPIPFLKEIGINVETKYGTR